MAIVRGTEEDDQLNGTAGVDTIYGLAGSDTLNGGAGNDTLYGGGGFNDYLDGGTGADKMIGGVGDSTYFVDNVGDQVLEYDENGTDKIVSSISYALNDDQFIEDLYLSGGVASLNGSGNWLSNLISGNDGNNLLSGKAGVDTLNGNAGNDTLDGGDDSDNLYGGAGVDTLVGGRGEDNLYGGDGNDILNGGIQDDFLDGDAGADVMTGGSGSDDYNVDNIGDRIVENDEAGFDEVYSTVSYTLGSQFIENLYLRGESNLTGTGNNQKNEIGGNDGNNTLYGLGGDDNLLGNVGNDILDGGQGIDRLEGRSGDDTYFVDNARDQTIEVNGGGSDRVYSSISYSIATQFVENIYLTGSGNMAAAGNNLANGMVGNSGNNVLNGGLGSDYLVGGAGNDFFTFNTALGVSNVDTIKDFNVLQDTIRVDNAIFTALGGAGALAASAFHVGTGAHDADDRMIYDSATGVLFYDSNGSVAGGAVQFATLSKGLGLTNADFLIV